MDAPHNLQPPRKKLHILQLLPNLVSILGLCSGLTAIRFAVDGRFATAIALIGLAAALDALDGRLARMLKSESAIGAELDSLCDLVNFGFDHFIFIDGAQGLIIQAFQFRTFILGIDVLVSVGY